jgi:small subunit ribosomal protein S1
MAKYYPERFNRRGHRALNLYDMEKAMRDGTILEGFVEKSDKELNITIKTTNGLLAIIPFDEFEYHMTPKPTKGVAVLSKIGKTVMFKVKSIEDTHDGKLAILSRSDAQKECYENYISTLKVGDVIDARATTADKHGVFCDIGCGIIALLPLESVCTTRITDPSVSLRRMSRIKVIIKSTANNRIVLTHKELLGTWDEEVQDFNIGDTVGGIVRVIESYGVFVELTPNLVGLAESYPDLKVGDHVSVYIKNIIPEKMKIKLLIVSKVDNYEEDEYLTYRYRVPESGNVRDWVYSPAECEKRIESHF